MQGFNVIYTISVSSTYSINMWNWSQESALCISFKTVYSRTDLSFGAGLHLYQSVSLQQRNRIPALHTLLASWANSWVYNWWTSAKPRTKSEICSKTTCLDKILWSKFYAGATISCCYAEASAGIFFHPNARSLYFPLIPFQFAFVPPSTAALNFPFSRTNRMYSI